jgi:hypothetical protein
MKDLNSILYLLGAKVVDSTKAMQDEEMLAEIEDFLEGFNRPTCRGMRVNGVRVATWSSRDGWSGIADRMRSGCTRNLYGWSEETALSKSGLVVLVVQFKKALRLQSVEQASCKFLGGFYLAYRWIWVTVCIHEFALNDRKEDRSAHLIVCHIVSPYGLPAEVAVRLTQPSLTSGQGSIGRASLTPCRPCIPRKLSLMLAGQPCQLRSPYSDVLTSRTTDTWKSRPPTHGSLEWTEGALEAGTGVGFKRDGLRPYSGTPSGGCAG